MKKLTHEDFLQKLLEKNEYYRNGEFKIISEYLGGQSKLQVLDKYGAGSMDKSCLFLGYKTTIKSANNPKEYFLNLLKYSNYSIYSQILDLEDFKNMTTKCKVLTKYGWVFISPSQIQKIKNFNICSALDKTEFWKNRCLELRKNSQNIDYSDVKYVNNNQKVELKCKLHNYKYSQSVQDHIEGIQSCPYCMTKVVMYNTTTIVTHKDFIEGIDGVFYVVKLTKENENFYKVGVSSKNRFIYRMNKLRKNYDVLVEYKEELNMLEAFKTEQFFLEEFKRYSYIPEIKFQGYTECLTTNPIAEYYCWFNNR